MLLTLSTGPRLLFRADGNATIGLGHVIRTLALAERLRGLAPGTFLVRQPTPAVAALVAAAGWALHPLPPPSSLTAEANYLACHVLHRSDLLVLDGYDFVPAYQRCLLASGCRLLLLDDLLTQPVLADIVLNHSPGVTAAHYQAPASTELLLGPAHALLRLPFLEAAVPPAPPAPVVSVLVCFGGADPLGLTIRTLAALRPLLSLRQVGLVVGAAFGQLPALRAAAADAGTTVSIYQEVDAPKLVRLLQAYDAVVAPASTVLIEALVLGRPVITGYYADNQRALANYVAAHQQAYSAGNMTETLNAATLQQGLRWLETIPRHPYTERLQPEAVRQAVQRLLNRSW